MIELMNLGHCNVTIDLLKTTLNKNGHYNINIHNHLRHNSLIQSNILCPKNTIIKNTKNTIQNKLVNIIIQQNYQLTYKDNIQTITNQYFQNNKHFSKIKLSRQADQKKLLKKL